MTIDGETTLTVYGLDEDNKAVRADVFAAKLRAFIAGIAIADKHVNGRRRYVLIVEDLSKSSARAKIREKRKTSILPTGSAVETYQTAMRSIYNGDAAIKTYPLRLVKTIKSLSVGVEKAFAHAEVSFDDENTNVVRIDDYLLRQVQRAEISGIPPG